LQVRVLPGPPMKSVGYLSPFPIERRHRPSYPSTNSKVRP